MTLRFCMVTTFYPPYHYGGDGVFVQALSNALVEKGHHVEVVHCEDAYRLRGDAISDDGQNTNGVVVHRLRSAFGPLSPLITQQTGMPGLKRRALNRILDKSFDVIHFHNISLIGGPGVLAMGRAPVKLYTTHEHWLVCPMHVLWKNREKPCDKPECLRCCLISGTPPQLWRYTGMVQRNLEHVDALLSPSEFTAKRHREGGVTRPIYVLPLFAGSDTPIQPNSPTHQRPQFLYVGRLAVSKGVTDLVEEFERLPQYDLSIAGEGGLLDSLKHRFGNCANIHFLGQVPRQRLIELYRQSTALIVPSIGPESFGLVTIEAMSCGTPVIVREAGGSAEPINATGAGIVYHTADELRRAICRIADDSAFRESLAARARSGFEQHYTSQAHLNEYFRIIETIRASKVEAR